MPQIIFSVLVVALLAGCATGRPHHRDELSSKFHGQYFLIFDKSGRLVYEDKAPTYYWKRPFHPLLSPPPCTPPTGLGMGISKERVIAVLGKPNAVRGNAWFYWTE